MLSLHRQADVATAVQRRRAGRLVTIKSLSLLRPQLMRRGWMYELLCVLATYWYVLVAYQQQPVIVL